jgi:hypothetical protein
MHDSSVEFSHDGGAGTTHLHMTGRKPLSIPTSPHPHNLLPSQPDILSWWHYLLLADSCLTVLEPSGHRMPAEGKCTQSVGRLPAPLG